MKMGPNITKNILDIMHLAISSATLIGIFYTLGKFLRAPEKSQNDRITALEQWAEKTDRRLDDGNDHFSSIDKGTKVTQESILAIMDALISGDNTDELKRKRADLYDYLSSK